MKRLVLKMREYYKSIDIDGQMFDFKQFYKEIAEKIPNNARLIEVGLNNGKSAIYLAEELLNIDKPVDRFIGIDNCAYGGQNQRNEIIKNIIGAGVNIEFLEMSSLDASCKFPGNYLDFCFLDSSHNYEQTKAEIILWYQKIKDGGILAGHDFITHEEVRNAVNEIIPKDAVCIQETENGYGVWWIEKSPSLKLNF